MNQCAYEDYQIEDAKFNATYNTIRKMLNAQEKEQVKQVQLAWIDFRDNACEFESRLKKEAVFTHWYLTPVSSNIPNIAESNWKMRLIGYVIFNS